MSEAAAIGGLVQLDWQMARDPHRGGYTEPTVAFHGSIAASWHALGVCFDNGLPVSALRRVWNVLDSHIPTGPYWEITFREKVY